jgi:phosphoenolpyruvate carboxykinase (GTP)
VLRRDPMAMLPFCGYNMGDYFNHWLNMGKKLQNPPKIFFVNWFRKDETRKFLWPGYGENIRVLKWIIARSQGKGKAKETPIGLVPDTSDFDLTGLDLPKENINKLFSVDNKGWDVELKEAEAFFKKFGPRMPQAMRAEFELLEKRLELK